MSRDGLRFWSAVLTFAIFLVDVLTPLEGAVAVLYVIAILLAARTNRRNDIIVAAVGCSVLTIAAYLLSHDVEVVASPALRALMSLAAIGITTLLALQNHSATKRLAAQARLLNLSHDMIFVRDRGGVITFWNRAAEQAYGWSADEAVGQHADALLRTKYFDRREDIETGLLDTGRWEGRLEQRTKAGSALAVDARWALQRDHLGKPVGVLETHTDVTDRVAAHNALVQSEQRYRRMFDASRVGVIEEDWSAVRTALNSLETGDVGLRDYLAANPEFVRHARRLASITDVNPALQKMAGASGSAAFIANVDRLLGENDRSFLGALVAFAEGERFHEGETDLVSFDGRKVPVLFTISFPAEPHGDRNVLAFVIDITERKQAQDALLAAQAELAHAARVATLGEFSASIAHEVNQPLAAIVTSGEAGLRWLRRDVPDLKEVATTIGHIVAQGRRASEIVTRIRTFLKKAPPQQDLLQIDEIIEEATLLIERELVKDDIALIVKMEHGLPPVRGDRIQLQQVLVNLLINAGQAMSGRPGSHTVTLRAGTVDGENLAITVQDSGPGIQPDDLPRLFDPFFTTKDGGMGMGLAICRTTVEAHGGRLSVESPPGSGATFHLTLPFGQELALP
ncbi:PAS domain-containing sensor histidine kinase [Bradyrhizobium japonicum]|uniref:histidine kinase n=1 Tax=Bradyrhizobium japonicum TaxID=375 RepID=A0ABV2S1I8_BRAJP|nr:PAS domain-containing sensor histidine kinase [Bradyrhizobium japonicum]MCP1767371.1 PAS domain S-box-containing protein [Bradyrhizobium japonicum]MCP1789510.1 PAS domain S-box-containing protein [Bradyrhizobium japonicum]MCP1802009.1 PAS domain S-box-containing protein [Bradyrhizobium japonicum]MCP1820319.1 PAS domain S-box-containing protein [Bradyrhizobium japonicum]MCP1868172.1 PAS domain S-box-containing protein [Bradyrhizobium japonicum]